MRSANWDLHSDDPPLSRPRGDPHRSTHQSGTFSQSLEPAASLACPAHLVADSVVLDDEAEPVLLPGQDDATGRRLGVAHNIGQRLLDDTVGGGLHVGGEAVAGSEVAY